LLQIFSSLLNLSQNRTLARSDLYRIASKGLTLIWYYKFMEEIKITPPAIKNNNFLVILIKLSWNVV